eukprot:TRINITY_DN66125_c0_g1_i1.p1 TRINITY_DN66125_c0_g1~~TRINITY_DN66125_c0_g1_i1.p1  ORF type:complete len:338 (+),score=101.09 TRINITY_DN66125_c0_g1_i1:79-1014(+)
MPPKAEQSVLATLPPIAASAATVSLVMYPADVMRALKMASASGGETNALRLLRNFIAAHGVQGLASQGVAAELTQRTISRVSKFFCFAPIHRGMWGVDPSQGTPLTKGLAGAAATFPEMWMCTPFESAKIVLQLDHKNQFNNSATKVARWVYKERGWKGLYCGYAGLQYRQACWTSIYFATVDDCTAQVKTVLGSGWAGGSASQVLGGLVAGLIGAACNTPGDVLRTNVQKHEKAKWLANPGAEPRGTFGPAWIWGGIHSHIVMARQIVAASGVGGLWKGFGFKALHLGGGGALLNFLIPFFKRHMGVTRE